MAHPTTDPLAPLLALDGVAAAVDSAREAVDKVHAHPANRKGWPTTAAEASVRAARASAAIEGAAVELPDDSVVRDPVLAGALRVAESLGPLLSTWQRAPLQVLARIHVLAAADLAESDALGRAVLDADGSGRLDLLSRLITGASAAPAPVLASVVHGELLALQPFPSANGVVARAAARLTVIGSGLDSKGLVVPEVACYRAGAEYTDRAAGFASGAAEGVRAWIIFCCETMVSGAREASGIADATMD